ncbi:hypothetical protein K439DRAFT_1631531, partial [Ramaria rubella]
MIDAFLDVTHGIFEVLFKSGNRAWLPYINIQHLEDLDAYLEASGQTHCCMSIGPVNDPNSLFYQQLDLYIQELQFGQLLI